MARVCPLTGKSVLYGNKVSHANNKSKRRFLPNLQNISLLSDALGIKLKLKLSTSAIRTVEKFGGLDNFLISSSDEHLSSKLRKIKKTIESKISAV